MYQVKLAEVKNRLPDLIDIAIKGEEVFIFKDGQQAVQLVPTELPKRHPQFGSAKGLIIIADDFDAPLEDFNEYRS
jgi:antitoxin (DNA-binding transcriptional repressor) of toxin-antitoxin stability system